MKLDYFELGAATVGFSEPKNTESSISKTSKDLSSTSSSLRSISSSIRCHDVQKLTLGTSHLQRTYIPRTRVEHTSKDQRASKREICARQHDSRPHIRESSKLGVQRGEESLSSLDQSIRLSEDDLIRLQILGYQIR